MAAKQTDILDLSTTGEIERKTFSIDGKRYEFRSPDELTLSQQQSIRFALTYVQKFAGDDEVQRRPEDGKKADDLLNKSVDLCTLKLPKKVLNTLTDMQKLRIVIGFSGATVHEDGSVTDKDGKVIQPATAAADA